MGSEYAQFRMEHGLLEADRTQRAAGLQLSGAPSGRGQARMRAMAMTSASTPLRSA
ncbi:hypothetical protein J2Z19_000818 [Ensifer adhaerens]|uniref:Uncharacterized protein n=1 Tax=Ensifer adhaerens TaxID=106592 RepID=A0ACC5SR02_ENSAD|nr:hypothetical protein [Ensifer adhaerens]